MVKTDKYGGSWWLKEDFFSRQLCKMGFGRCEFFLHLGTVSLGCITVDKRNNVAVRKYDKLQELLQGDDPDNIMVVVP